VSVLDDLLALRCAGCGVAGPAVCADCRLLLLAGPTPAGEVDGVPVVVATRYPPQVGRMVVGCKDGGGWGLTGALADALALAGAAALDAVGVGPGDAGLGVVSVPARRADRIRRGGDPVAAVAHRATRRLSAAGAPVRAVRGLIWVRAADDQGHLPAAARRGNVAGALSARPGLPDRLLLVDDLVTTGATAAAAVAALAAAGSTVVAIAAVARPPLGLWTGADDGRLR
jgi:predicted amidophosphoribosyltransferase